MNTEPSVTKAIVNVLLYVSDLLNQGYTRW